MFVDEIEGRKAFNLAGQLESRGELERALKMYKKSAKLYGEELCPIIVKSRIRKVEIRLKKKTSPSPQTTTSTETTATDDIQREGVRRIVSCKTFYEVLQVDSDRCSIADVKKQYKRLALKYHPDKCQISGAEDAFKVISRAYFTLSDPGRRRHYDLLGGEGLDPDSASIPSTAASTTQGRGGSRKGFNENMSAEELLNIFFGAEFEDMFANAFTSRSNNDRMYFSSRGSGLRSRRTQYFQSPFGTFYVPNNGNGGGDTRRRYGSNPRSNASPMTSAIRCMFQVIGIALVFFLAMHLLFERNSAVSTPPFSFAHSTTTPIMRQSMRSRILYFVAEPFPPPLINENNDAKSSFDLNRFEDRVEQSYMEHLRSRCSSQLKRTWSTHTNRRPPERQAHFCKEWRERSDAFKETGSFWIKGS